MWHLINKSKQKISNQEEGFITLEILVALFIALGFVAVSMQSLVYAMAIKVQAQEKQRANQLIQEDLERINQLGSLIPNTNDIAYFQKCKSEPNPADGTVSYNNGFAKELWDDLVADAPEGGTNTVTNLLRKVEADGSITPQGKQLALRRFHISNGNSVAPHRTLKIGYQVWEWDGTNFINKNGGAITAADEPIAETYVEVIPDVALACP